MESEINWEVEISEAVITKLSYPILWVGENGYSITRYGKLLQIKPSYYNGQERLELVVVTAEFMFRDIPFVRDKWYIVAGGIDPKLAFVRDIIGVYREEDVKKIILGDLDLPVNTEFELAAGVKKKAVGVIYERIYSSDMFEPIEIAEGESITAKLYPETFKIFKQGNKMFIKYVEPKDC